MYDVNALAIIAAFGIPPITHIEICFDTFLPFYLCVVFKFRPRNFML